MSKETTQALQKQSKWSERKRELLTFLVLAFGIWPIVAVAVVGGFGFLVWMFQIIFGPPGPSLH